MGDHRHHHRYRHDCGVTTSRGAALVDSGNVYQHKKRNATLLAALASIHLQCVRVKERQHTARQLHARLNQVFLRATTTTTHSPGTKSSSSADGSSSTLQLLDQPKRVAQFTALLDALQLTLKRHIKLKANIVHRVLHHRMFSLQLRSIHYQLTAFLRETLGIPATTSSASTGSSHGFPLDWRAAFSSALRQDESVLHETLVTVVDSTSTASFLSKEYQSLPMRQQMEVLLDLRHELTQTIDVSPLLEDSLKLIYKRLVRLFGWDLNERARRVPRWFVPTASVDFSPSRDLLTKHKPTYRGEMMLDDRGGLKRHLVVMKWIHTDAHVDETAHILDLFVAKYAAIDHPHVLRLRGANYVAGVPFVIRDYATHGTLSGHVARLRHSHGGVPAAFEETVTWRLLVDACEGLLYLHEHSALAHGGLKASNLLVNHRGRACIADVGLQSLRHQLMSSESEDREYVRWLAPELIDHKGRATMAGDVFALGMAILEILSDETPWSAFSAVDVLERKRTGSHLPPRPSSIGNREWRLIERMCAVRPAVRLPIRQVFEALVALSRGLTEDVVPAMYHPAEEEEEKEEDEAKEWECDENEFETESISSYKTTMEIADLIADQEGDEEDADSMAVHLPEDREEEEKRIEPDNGDEVEEEPEEEEDDDDEDVYIDSIANLSMASDTCAAAMAFQTSGQMRTAIEYLAETRHDSPPHTLLPHLQLLRAFAKQEAQSILECGGVRVLTALFVRHTDADVRSALLEIYSAMLQSGHATVVESLVAQGTVELVLEFFASSDTCQAHADACVSLLLELMGHSDEAKRVIGDPEKKYVQLMEKKETLHRRLLQEVKSVLARFKQSEGNMMLKEGFHVLAIQRFTEAIQLDRRRGMYYADRSLAYCHARQYHEAAEDAERCVRYTPFDAQGYMRYGIAMRHLHKYSEALAALRKGYQVNPHHPQLAMVMGEVQELYNKHKAKK